MKKSVPGTDAARAESASDEAIDAIAGIKMKKRVPATGQGPPARSAFIERKKESWQDARRNPARHKGRRTMGRAGGR